MAGKYQAYSEYKSVEVEFLDKLPTDWDVMRGKFVFNEFSERSSTGTETLLSVSEYYGVKPRGDVIADGDFLSRAESLVDYKKCERNDLVMNIMLAWKRGLGVTKYDGIVSPAYSVFRFNESANPNYMHYLLRIDTYIGHFKTRSTGVIDSRLRLYPESFGSVPIILPPVHEQQKIANFLDHETAKIDTLVEKQQQLIKLLLEKRQAVISHAVTKGLPSPTGAKVPMRDSGVEWLGEVPEHWVMPKVSHIGRVLNGSTPDKTNLSYWDDGTIPWLASGCLNSEIVDEPSLLISEQAYQSCSVELIPANSLLVGMVGQGKTRGTSAILTIDSCINQNMAAIIPGVKIQVRFLYFLFQAMYNDLRELGRGGNQAALNCEIIGSVRIPLPPIEEQIVIVEMLDDLLIKLSNTDALGVEQVELLQERRTALISAAVTGKIDVRNWAAPAPSNGTHRKAVS